MQFSLSPPLQILVKNIFQPRESHSLLYVFPVEMSENKRKAVAKLSTNYFVIHFA